MGIWLKEEAHGQGYGFEALSLLKNWESESGRILDEVEYRIYKTRPQEYP